MRVILVANNAPNNITEIINIEPTDYIVAIDGGFDELLKQKIKIDLVIGDFDSVQNFKKINKYEMIKLNREKDFSDTYVAVKYAYTLSNNVYLIGGIQGKRIEHFVANMMLFETFPKLMIIDDNSKIYLLEEGKHLIKKSVHTSFFSYKDAIITLEGFKYNLKDYELNRYDQLGLSNEVVSLYGEITISKGKIIVIESNI